jgi:hypothetical protein
MPPDSGYLPPAADYGQAVSGYPPPTAAYGQVPPGVGAGAPIGPPGYPPSATGPAPGMVGPPGGPPPRRGGSRTALVIVAVLAVLLLVGVGVALVATSGGDGEDEDVETAQERDEETTTTTSDRDEGGDDGREDEDDDEWDRATSTTERETTTTTQATTTTVPEEVWTTYAATVGCFTVDLPGSPEEVTEPVDSLGEGYAGSGSVTLDNLSALYLLIYLDLQPDYYVADPVANLNATLDGITGANPDFVVSSRADTTFAGVPALEFTGTVDGTPVEGIGLVAGQRIFFLMAGGDAGEYDFPRFRDSLRITC